MGRVWYILTGWTGSNPFETSSYWYIPGNLKPGCLTGTSICAIYAYNGDINPYPLSANIQNYISNALSTQVPQPIGPGAKKYVYLRS